MNPTFEFKAELWRHSSGRWVMLTVPDDESDEIREMVPLHGGFGSVRVEPTIGSSTWRTSVFSSKNRGNYVLPLKQPVRKAEDLSPGDIVDVSLTVLIE